MTHGILGSRPRQMHGLSGYVSTIPGECWAQAGFKDCNAVQYNAAKIVCQSQGKDNDACIGPLADQFSMSGCKCTRTKAPTTSKPRPAVVTSSAVPSEDAFGPPPGLFGMDPKTLLMVGAVGVGLYVFLGQKPKKGST